VDENKLNNSAHTTCMVKEGGSKQLAWSRKIVAVCAIAQYLRSVMFYKVKVT